MNETEEKEETDEDKEDKEETEEDKEEKIETELPVLSRLTKKQVQEVYALLEEGKNLEEISKFFEEKYKCTPLSRERLQKHALKFHKLKRETETDDGGGDNKNHDLEPSSAEITNQDIQEMKEKMLSAPENIKKEKTGSVLSDSIFSGIDMKWVIVAAVVIAIIVIILLTRRKKEKKEPEPEPQPVPQQKPQQPQIKWV